MRLEQGSTRPKENSPRQPPPLPPPLPTRGGRAQRRAFGSAAGSPRRAPTAERKISKEGTKRRAGAQHPPSRWYSSRRELMSPSTTSPTAEAEAIDSEEAIAAGIATPKRAQVRPEKKPASPTRLAGAAACNPDPDLRSADLGLPTTIPRTGRSRPQAPVLVTIMIGLCGRDRPGKPRHGGGDPPRTIPARLLASRPAPWARGATRRDRQRGWPPTPTGCP